MPDKFVSNFIHLPYIFGGQDIIPYICNALYKALKPI